MLDPKLLRNDSEQVLATLKRRGVAFDYDYYQQLEQQRKRLQVEVEQIKAEQNTIAKQIGVAKKQGHDCRALLSTAAEVKQKMEQNEQNLNALQIELRTSLSGIPNLLDESVPDGKDESDNLEIRNWGQKTAFAFRPKDHVDIAESLRLMDNAAAAKIAGSRFTVLFGELAELQRALIRFMLDIHTREHGYQEVYVPYMVNADSLFGTGQLPKFETDLFRLTTDQDFYLIPTAEVPVTNLCRDRIFDADTLPLQYVAQTPCFRSEAGSYGKDTRGIIRQHQFEKVELVHIVKPTDSWQALEELTQHAETILQRLELPYRVVTLCAGDTGFCSAKTYDLEIWFPSQDCYREISSCSNMTDFQARRMKIRVRTPNVKNLELAHTLNGSALAVGRTLAAILENNQDKNGNVRIPAALVSYMQGKEVIGQT